MAVNLALSATRRLANRVSLCSELSAARRSLRRSVLMSEICSIPIALSATRRFANRVSLSSELSAARRSLLLRSLASSLVWIHDESLTNCNRFTSCCDWQTVAQPTYPRLVSTAATVREKTWEQRHRPTDTQTDPQKNRPTTITLRCACAREG